MIASCTLWRRQDRFPVQIDDPFNRAHQETQRSVVVLGDDSERILQIHQRRLARGERQIEDRQGAAANARNAPYHPAAFRSEEHTSELQSLMRISYAVFCLNKKKSNKEKSVEHRVFVMQI